MNIWKIKCLSPPNNIPKDYYDFLRLYLRLRARVMKWRDNQGIQRSKKHIEIQHWHFGLNLTSFELFLLPFFFFFFFFFLIFLFFFLSLSFSYLFFHLIFEGDFISFFSFLFFFFSFKLTFDYCSYIKVISQHIFRKMIGYKYCLNS